MKNSNQPKITQTIPNGNNTSYPNKLQLGKLNNVKKPIDNKLTTQAFHLNPLKELTPFEVFPKKTCIDYSI